MKPYMNDEELTNELVNNKNIERGTIPDGIFKERAYISLVLPYKRLICINKSQNTNEYIYKQAGDFNEYINFARTDDYISNKFNIYIECFEKYFKTYVGEILAKKMSSTDINCNNYTSLSRYLHTIPSYKELKEMDNDAIKELEIEATYYDFIPFHKMFDKEMRLEQVDKNIILNRRRALDNFIKLNRSTGPSNNPLVQHCINHGDVPPVWAIIHTLTFGDILAIFNMFPRTDRVELTKKLLCKNIVRAKQISKLSSKINIIREIRNNINHYEPLIPALVMYKDKNFDSQILSIIGLLKRNYKKSIIPGAKVIRRVKCSKLGKNDFNKKYIIFLNNIMEQL